MSKVNRESKDVFTVKKERTGGSDFIVMSVCVCARSQENKKKSRHSDDFNRINKQIYRQDI